MAIKLKTTTYTESGGEIVYKTNQSVVSMPFSNKCNTRFCVCFDKYVPVSGYCEKAYVEIAVCSMPAPTLDDKTPPAPPAPITKKVPLIYHQLNLDGEQLARYVNTALYKNQCTPCYYGNNEPCLTVLYNPKLNEAYVLNNNILPPIPQTECGC